MPHHPIAAEFTTRRAVATLDAAQDKAMRAVITASVGHSADDWGGYAHVARTLPEDGGTLRLPDGTVIEAARVDWGYFTGYQTDAQPGDALCMASLDAYNAAQA